MWTDKFLNKEPRVNNINYNMGTECPILFGEYLYTMEDYRRRVLRSNQCDWLGRRIRKIYTRKIGKTAVLFKHISFLKTKGVYNTKKYLRINQKADITFFNESNEFCLKKVKINL